VLIALSRRRNNNRIVPQRPDSGRLGQWECASSYRLAARSALHETTQQSLGHRRSKRSPNPAHWPKLAAADEHEVGIVTRADADTPSSSYSDTLAAHAVREPTATNIVAAFWPDTLQDNSAVAKRNASFSEGTVQPQG